MISFDIQRMRFNYRVAGVCVDDGHVLLHKFIEDDFWALPGGRVEIGETSEAALLREMREELSDGAGAQVGRLLWIAENFFTYNGIPGHELGLYYSLSFPPDVAIYDKTRTHEGIEQHVRLLYRWFPLATLDDTPLYPIFLRTRLCALPAAPQHIVDRVSRT